MLSYPPETWAVGDAIVRQCGKMLVLDRLLVKMRLSGHRCGSVCSVLWVRYRWFKHQAGLGGRAHSAASSLSVLP